MLRHRLVRFCSVVLISLLFLSCTQSGPSKEKAMLPAEKLALQTNYTEDLINDMPLAQQKGPLILSSPAKILITGWAVDERSKDAAGGVIVDIDGKLYASNYGVERPDVAEHFKLPAYKNSGWTLEIPASAVGGGTHTLAVYVLTKEDKKAYYASDQRITLEVR